MEKTHSIVNINSDGEVVCFCSYEEYLAGKCSCRNKYNCPEALISVEVIPGTRPSDQVTTKLKASSTEMKKSLQGIESGAKKIKEGLTHLERSLSKNRHRI